MVRAIYDMKETTSVHLTKSVRLAKYRDMTNTNNIDSEGRYINLPEGTILISKNKGTKHRYLVLGYGTIPAATNVLRVNKDGKAVEGKYPGWKFLFPSEYSLQLPSEAASI
jgi:hypothetical protein